ncbi:mechanosensitive ion channel family protein [Litoreibacter arenae]|uniref:Potassium efflux system KefA protein / Small-conductance mechanosensitive channel n=1 Tax=Litoreibacter arenae DSM 19593 TaxID=1123360 RepID=S9QD47_9RHOB|nr:mechanosensitive ion channel domain-containing protein [Litoreibacter arenae]EPX77508.1 Potassium efflux system KefA protein / Small-conductance mechanosensitive channel [Litoreibacter arenae DSM 19593]
MADDTGIGGAPTPPVDGTTAPVPNDEPGLVPDLATQPVTELVDLGETLLVQAETFLASMLRPWNAYQIGIVIALWALAHVLRTVLGPPIRNWMGTREGWPKWRMRILAVIHQRLRSIFFVILLWLAVVIMREFTWPSRSYLLGIIATLATAWLFVVFATRLIRSRFLRRTVRYGAWVYVTLHILGLTTDAARLMDRAALEAGEFRISLLLVVQAIVILGVLIAVARFFTVTTSNRIQTNEDISPSMKVLFVKVLQIAFYGIAFYIGVKAIGIDLTGLAVLSGAIGVGLGFGLQKVVSNLVSGVIILLDKSIKPGDVISLGETFGWINTLGARYASVVTRDGKEYLIPNEDLITNQVVNWSHSDAFVRLDIYFGTAYGDDPHEVRKLAIAAAKDVDRVLSFKAPVCHIVGFGDSSVDYILRFWIRDPTQGLTNIRGNVYLALWDAFKEHDISIPFPQREVKMLGGEMPKASD